MAVLEVKQIRKNFDGEEVLKGIDFSMEKGEVLAIIGSSGSGKTTLLRCLNFLLTPDAGQIFVNGECIFDAEDTRKLSEKEIREKRLHFGLVFQSFNLFPQYNVLRNITLAAELQVKEEGKARKASKQEKKEALAEVTAYAEQLLSQVGLLEKKQAYPCELSGGQQQRVAIARALALNPDILCFDEPTSALDPALTGEVLRVIRGLKSSERTMIVVTHEMEFARRVADKVIYMADGVIEEYGEPEQIFTNPQSEKLKAFLQNAQEGL
ncbi:MAG: amino acid ABC transporter ATP-binding protein [Lachnospiraceae bacterium]|nr:amino acid ABC transporter ATP-binding protein [Lachnospiraceae bacterium]